MKIYNNQTIIGLRPETQLAIRVADLWYRLFGQELEITWTTGGNHMVGSLHPKRRAFDSLSPKLKVEEIAQGIRITMGPEYDVIVERDHLHIEWDPK